jgi:hypothetical protein
VYCFSVFQSFILSGPVTGAATAEAATAANLGGTFYT